MKNDRMVRMSDVLEVIVALHNQLQEKNAGTMAWSLRDLVYDLGLHLYEDYEMVGKKMEVIR